ncbi:hypothetical protein HCEG_00561 [Histoplasma capsulatum var. duboisii H88]|uniref:Uncharacterized protein n=2 Tax=Ajellomyces capsulatus TaxID=5037 RepID=F0U4U5_AJEC8|nr:hypothetical protein HCDG_00825 [Histoplasma capsulatum H143]EGC41199.1 hypothetical protein HCEG_00561 [Histoplasma capsulatum var. duboisii H88]
MGGVVAYFGLQARIPSRRQEPAGLIQGHLASLPYEISMIHTISALEVPDSSSKYNLKLIQNAN